MNNKIKIYNIILLSLFCFMETSFAQNNGKISKLNLRNSNIIGQESSEKISNLLENTKYFKINQKQSDKHSVSKAVIFSSIIPGGGEFYNKSFIKGVVFAGIEVISWAFYSKFKNEGNDIDREFKEYAGEHWQENVYRIWLENYKRENNGTVPHNFTETLPGTKTQQYYEMIGKYEQFLIGWDDVTDYEHISERRAYYMDRRGKSNDYLTRASYIAMFTIVNRIVSIVDSAIMTKKYNVKIDSALNLKSVNGLAYPGYSIYFKW